MSGDCIFLCCNCMLIKMLKKKAFHIAKNLKYDGYQRGLASMVYKFFNKNLLVVVSKTRILQTNN